MPTEEAFLVATLTVAWLKLVRRSRRTEQRLRAGRGRSLTACEGDAHLLSRVDNTCLDKIDVPVSGSVVATVTFVLRASWQQLRNRRQLSSRRPVSPALTTLV